MYRTAAAPASGVGSRGSRSQDALERLASMDTLDLCGEAKVEKCRATRDLRSCGRIVQHVLTSCGHASLCAECSQRCDVCPICRVLIPKHDGKLRLRLYYECVETGLISRRQDEEFKDKGGELQFWTEDVRHLYSLFDVALENNLISLVCHYVSDVCMDENAVSSDAIVAMLLDGAVVKEWCKRILSCVTFNLQEIYSLGMKQMQMKSDLLHKFAMQLDGVANVLEVLEASLLQSFSPQLLELQHLSEKVSKVKQHLEVMAWCVRHQFLENVESRYMSTSHWRTTVHERKAAALERAWPDYSSNIVQLGSQPQATLFIEDALANLGIGQAHNELGGETPDLGWLRQGGGSYLSPSKFRRDGLAVPYPMENVRAAVDILFLEGNSDLIIAKRAIFLYYLFDRHWTLRDMEWANLVDDYAGTFGITRHSVLESLVFYLLDDHTDEALQEACRLLPEIVGRTTHPKVARVLLERQSADTALMVLRCCGYDGQLGFRDSGPVSGNLVSLSEAVTAVRVRLDCGLLTEAYIYQRTHCTRLRTEQSKRRLVTVGAQEGEDMDGCRNWLTEMEVLVGEICCLCIRRKLVDGMIELPWDTDEEKFLHKCLLDRTTQDPSSFVGSLLVVFYIQRCRYFEACQIDKRLSNLEQQFISQATDEKMVEMIENARQWRTRFTEKCIELLPEVQRQQLRSGNICECSVSPFTTGDQQKRLDDMEAEQAVSSSLSMSGSDNRGTSSHGLTSVDARKSEIIQLKSTRPDDFLVGFPGWGGFRQPSILHGKPFRSSVESPSIFKKLDLPELNGPANRKDQERPGFSPLRGRKLKYDIDSGKPAEASESLEQRPPALKYTPSLEMGNMEKQGAYKSKRSKGLSFHSLPLSNEKLSLEASKRTQNWTENQQENDHPILRAISPSRDVDQVSPGNGFLYTQEQRATMFLESPHSSNAGLHDRSVISSQTDLVVSGPSLSTPGSSGKRSPSDRSWLASPSDDNSLRGKGGGVAPSFSVGAEDWNLLQGFSCRESFQSSPSSGVETAKPNGAVRWRSDGGEEEEQPIPTSLGRPKGYTGTHGKSVGRSRFYSSCIP